MKTNNKIKFLMENGLSKKTVSVMTESQINLLFEKFKKMKKEETKEQVQQQQTTKTIVGPKGGNIPLKPGQTTVSLKPVPNAQPGTVEVVEKELSEDETYAGNDIYTKGAFFMHSLRYVIGDDLFFPTIKKLSTDPKYTYDNFVTSKDVEELFSGAAGYSLKPFFDFYLRTTKTIEMNVKENGYRTYVIKPTNYFMDLPLDIMINGKIEKIKLTKEGLTVTSNTTPILDPNGFYLKTVTLQ